MPIVAIGIAIAVDVAAGSALLGGTLTALGAVAAVGATVAAVGSVTKDKALTIAGTVLGGIGAVGSLASAAGVLGDSASAPLFGTETAASTADGGAAADAASAGTIDTFSGQAGVTSEDLPPLGATDAAGGIPTPPIPPDAVPPPSGDAGLASATQNAADPAAGLINSAPPAGAEMAPQDAAALQAQQALVPAGTNATDTAIGENPVSAPTGAGGSPNPVPALPPGGLATNAPGQAALPGTPVTGTSGSTSVPGAWGSPNTSPDFQAGMAAGTSATAATPTPSAFANVLSGISDFTKNNQLLSYGILQSAGSLLSGATSTLTPAQVAALNAQANANNAAASLTQQQTANLAMPKAVAQSVPVTGAPAQLVPTPPTAAGFINQAPKITGVPA